MSRESDAAQLEALVELGQVVQALSTELGSFSQFFRQPPPLGVLYSGSVILDANGQKSIDFSEAFASVALTNLSGSTVTITEGGLASGPPDGGPGVFRVPAGGFACHNLLASQLAIYGTAGATLDLVVYLRPQPPSFGVTNALTTPPGTFANGVQVPVTNAAGLLVAANASRRLAIVQNVGTANGVLGLLGVTAVTGFEVLYPGQVATADSLQALYAIRQGGSDTTFLVSEVT